MRKVAAVVAVVCGLGLIVLPFALDLFDRAPAGERVTDNFRSTMSVDGLAALRKNFGTMGGAIDQFTKEMSPQLAQKLHMSPAEFAAYERKKFPAVAAGVEGIPPLVAFVSPVAAQLLALHDEFAAVDSLPFLGLPMSTIPYILLALGVVLVGLGIALWVTRGRAAPVVAALLGGAMIVVPLAFNYPSKASDASTVSKVGRVALSQQAATGAAKANSLIDGLVTEVNTAMIPALATQLHVTKQALAESVARDYPAVARGLTAWPSIKPGAVALAATQQASVDDAAKMNGLRFGALPWYIIGPGIALLLCAIASLVAGRRPADLEQG